MKQLIKKVLWGAAGIMQEAINQLISSSSSKDLILTPFAENQMYEWGLSKDTVKDVFYHGQQKPNDKYVLFKQYQGYRIYIRYQYDKQTGSPKIISVNKWYPKK